MSEKEFHQRYITLTANGHTYYVERTKVVGSMVDRKLEELRFAAVMCTDVRDFPRNDQLMADRFARLAILRARRDATLGK